jgi:hypothetical protein
VLEYARDWMIKNEGIVWVEHVAVGEKLSEISGFSYFGESGRDAKGQNIEESRGSIIASIAANGEGRNLQKWSRNLILSCPPGGGTWEQLLGRTHRQGQESDEVTIEVLLSCIEHYEGFEQAKRDALYVQDTTGQTQKLLTCDKIELTKEQLSRLKAKKNPIWNG